MPIRNLKDYMEKIILLEKKIGANVGYKIMEPFNVDTDNFIELQRAGKKIAEFIGLDSYTFIVILANQQKNVGGKIELRNGQKEVFIEISYDMLRFKDAVIATLAHEITHKYLHIHKITPVESVDYIHDNEVLTDIAAVFLGLGKLLLNGCQCSNSYKVNGTEGERTIIENLKVGYLDIDELSFVYMFICYMRKISETEYLKGLTENSLRAVAICRKKYGHYLIDYFKGDQDRAEFFKLLKVWGDDTVSDLLALEKFHKSFSNILISLGQLIDSNEYDPCLKYLYVVKMKTIINEMSADIKEHIYSINSYRSKFIKFSQFIKIIMSPLQRGKDAVSIRKIFISLFNKNGQV